MGFGASIKSAFGNWRDFKGRALRSEYWYFTLFVGLCNLAATLLDRLLGTHPPGDPDNGYIGLLVLLVLIVPHFAVLFRRLHDTDHSGWWAAGGTAYGFCVLLLFTLSSAVGAVMAVFGCLGVLLVLVWLVSQGTEGPNRFGPPRTVTIPHPEPVEG